MADGVAKRYIASMAERSTWKRPVDDFVEESPHKTCVPWVLLLWVVQVKLGHLSQS